MEVKVKLCGMMREIDIDYANQAKPDYVGFVFANTRRCITKEQAKIFRDKLNADILAVGVFVNEDVNIVGELLRENIIDMAQLHGEENREYIAKLKEISNKPIIKAIKVQDKEDIERVNDLNVECLLFDTYKKGVLGGTGETFNWDILREVKVNKPFFLAGGLSIHNVEEAMAKVFPYGLDLSSGIETDGYKDKEKMMEVVRRIKHVRE